MKRTGAALSLLIGLSLLGGGLSYAENLSTADNSKTYEYVNKGSGDATEGDPITVKHLHGWNQDKVTVGKDTTNTVTIEDYGAGKGSNVTVYGKNISFTNEQGGFWNGGGRLSVGNDVTDTVSFKTISGQNGASFAVRGREQTLGSINLGSDAILNAGGINTDSVTIDQIGLYNNANSSIGGTAVIDGKTISIKGSQEGSVAGSVNATGDSTLNLGTQYMTGDLHIQSLGVFGSSTVDIGNANAGDITIDEFGVGGTQTSSTGEPILNTITVSGNNLSIGNTRASESNAQVTFNARGDVTAQNGLVMTGAGLKSSDDYASVTVNAGGNVELGKFSQTTNPWDRNASLAAVGGHAKIDVTAAGNVNASGDFFVTGDGNIKVKAANISSDGLLHATGEDASLTLIAEDSNGNKGDIKAQELQVDSSGTASLTGKTITLAPDADGSSFHRSLHVTDCNVDMDADEINLASGILFNGTAELNLKAASKLTIGNALNENPSDTSAIRLTYGGGYGAPGTGKLYAGGNEADVTVNGSVAVVGSSDEKEIAWFNGKNLVFNATKMPSLSDNPYSDLYNAVALDFTDSQFWSGNDDTTETTTVNGHIFTSGSNVFVLHGSKAVKVNGLKEDFENNENAFSLTDRGSSSIQIGDEDTVQTTVNGEIVTGKDTVLYVGGKNVLLDNAGHTALYANAVSKNITIGKTSTNSAVAENTVIKGRILVNQPKTFQVLGKQITLMNGAAPDSGTLGTTVKTEEDGTSTVPDNHTHDAVVIQQAAVNALVIGEADSNVSIDGRLVGLNGGYSVDGDIIHIYEGTNKNQNLILTTGGAVNLGHDGTNLLQIDGGIWALGDSTNAVNLQGRNIMIDPASGMRAVQANAMPVTIGDSATENAVVNGEIWSVSHKAITLDANNYSLAANGSTYAARSTGGGSITVGHAGSTGVIVGDLTADAGSAMEVYLQGSGSQLNGTITDHNMDTVVQPVQNSAQRSRQMMGLLRATGSSATADSSDAGVTLHLNNQAVWSLEKDARVSNLQADGGIIHFDEDTTDQSLYAGNFAGEGTTIYMGHQGDAMVNDHLYIQGIHTGTTQLQLHAVNGKWTDGAIGSVLTSVGDEQGSFYLPEQEDRLFFHKVVLDTHKRSQGDTVTDGYSTDWYIKGFQKRPTDDKGNYTHTVRGIMGLDGINYHIWRDSQDNLFRRMGELHSGIQGKEGIWARVKSSEIQRDGQFPFEDKYTTYEVGYDQLASHRADRDHYQGIAFDYTEGKASYFGGRSDTNSYALGLYDTKVRHDGQYLDLAFRIHRLTNKIVAHDGISGHGDNTGMSLGAEYGWKKELGRGWFVEPQAQFTLGWLSGADWTMENGVHVEEDNIRSAVGRTGLRVGYQGHKTQFFVKADWYHEFGGTGQVHLSDDEGRLVFDEDYGDTWFEYGIGGKIQITPTTQIYADLDRSNGGTYHKNWSYDVGIRWAF